MRSLWTHRLTTPLELSASSVALVGLASAVTSANPAPQSVPQVQSKLARFRKTQSRETGVLSGLRGKFCTNRYEDKWR